MLVIRCFPRVFGRRTKARVPPLPPSATRRARYQDILLEFTLRKNQHILSSKNTESIYPFRVRPFDLPPPPLTALPSAKSMVSASSFYSYRTGSDKAPFGVTPAGPDRMAR